MSGRIHRIVVACAALALAVLPRATTAHANVPCTLADAGITDERLANGLRVLIRPLPSGTEVAIVLTFDIGEAHDPEGASGIAHLVEHLWVTAAAGAQPARSAEQWMHEPLRRTAANAQTGERYTLVASVVPAAQLSIELADYAARLHGLQVEQADLDRELPRLRLELANMYGGPPLLSALNTARQAAVPAPAGGQRGGVPEQIERLSLQQVRERLCFYGAANATLAVAGPVQPAETLRLVRDLFERAPPGDGPPALRPRAERAPIGLAHVAPAALMPPGHANETPVATMAFAASLPTDHDYPAFVLAVSALMVPSDTATRAGTPPVIFAPLDDPSTVTLVCPALAPGESGAAIDAALRAPIDALLEDPVGALRRARSGQVFGAMLGTLPLPEAALAQNPYLAALMLARHTQLGIDGSALQRGMQAVSPSDLQRVVGARFAHELGRTAVAGDAPPTLPQRVAAAAVEALASRAYFAERVDWTAMRTRMRDRLSQDATIEDARALILDALAQLHDPHTRLQVASAPSGKPERAASTEAHASAPPPRESTPRVIPSLPSANMLEGSIAYVQLPPCADTSPDHVREYANALHAAICAMRAAEPAGWIVDLRLNGGGTMWPMIAGLQPLLGDGTYGGSRARDGATTGYGIHAGSCWLEQGGARTAQFVHSRPPCASHASTAPIALLMGPWTMSSGEIVAAAFARHPAVRRFGESTAGLTTAVEPVALEDGSTLHIAVGAIVDAAGNVIPGPMAPDETVSWGEWPSQSDAAVRAALSWLASKKEPTPDGEHKSAD